MSEIKIESERLVQQFLLYGENISINGGTFTYLRFGLRTSENAYPTLSIRDCKIQGTGSSPALDLSEVTDGGSMTFTDIEINSDRPVRQWTGSSGNNVITANLINPTLGDSDFADSEMNKNSEINHKVRIALTVIDDNGDAIEDADVTITNSEGTELYSGQTDASGQINTTTTIVNYIANEDNPGRETNIYVCDIITDYNPLTIEISNDGKDTEIIKEEVTSDIDWVIAMQGKSYYQRNINAEINEKINSNIQSEDISGNSNQDNISGRADGRISGEIKDKETIES